MRRGLNRCSGRKGSDNLTGRDLRQDGGHHIMYLCSSEVYVRRFSKSQWRRQRERRGLMRKSIALDVRL